MWILTKTTSRKVRSQMSAVAVLLSNRIVMNALDAASGTPPRDESRSARIATAGALTPLDPAGPTTEDAHHAPTTRSNQSPSSAGELTAVATLADLHLGGSGSICGFSAELDPAAARRLLDLGFAPGATVTVIRRAPLRDPVVFAVADYEIALRRAEARRITVTPDQ